MKINKIGLVLKKHYKKVALAVGVGAVVSGFIYLNSDQYYRSLDEYDLQEKAQAGDKKAQYFLSSKLYFKEENRESGREIKKYWLTKSANNGYLPAMVSLCRWDLGDFEWCKKAAALGDDEAIYQVAKSYEEQENYTGSIRLYKKVVGRWFFHRDDIYAEKATSALAELYLKLDSKEEAEEWYKKWISLADSNVVKAIRIRQLADKYGNKKLDFGYEENVKKEFKLRREAADLDGYEDSDLAEAYLHGFGTKQDIPKALKIYEQLAIIDKEAAFVLAANYEDGRWGIEKDLEKAKFYYKMACKGDYWACKKLKELENQQ